MKTIDRRGARAEACVVCGASDARTLSFTRLEAGARVVVCGSHKMAHRNSERMARTVEELRVIVGDRRTAAV